MEHAPSSSNLYDLPSYLLCTGDYVAVSSVTRKTTAGARAQQRKEDFLDSTLPNGLTQRTLIAAEWTGVGEKE